MNSFSSIKIKQIAVNYTNNRISNVKFFYWAFTAATTSNPATIAYIQVKANGNVDCTAWKVTIVTSSLFGHIVMDKSLPRHFKHKIRYTSPSKMKWKSSASATLPQ